MDSGARLRNLGAVTLFVEDLPASRRFYEEVFGLEILNEDDDAVAFGFGNTIINVLRIEGRGRAHRAGRRGESSRGRALPAHDLGR